MGCKTQSQQGYTYSAQPCDAKHDKSTVIQRNPEMQTPSEYDVPSWQQKTWNVHYSARKGHEMAQGHLSW